MREDEVGTYIWDEYFDYAQNLLRVLCITPTTTAIIHTCFGDPAGLLESHDCNMSAVKAEEYSCVASMDGLREALGFEPTPPPQEDDEWGIACYLFLGHNADDRLQASMLRDWCIIYQNLLLAMACDIPPREVLSFLGYKAD